MGVGELFLVLLAVGGFWLWRRSRPANPAGASEYVKRTDGAFTVFNVRPSTPPKYVGIQMIGAFLVLFALAGLLGGSSDSNSTRDYVRRARAEQAGKDQTLAIALLLGGAALYWLGSRIDFRPKQHRNPREFRVSRDAVEVDGRSFASRDLHRLIIRNGMAPQEEVLIEANLSNAAALSGMAQRRKNAKVCYGLNLEAGGKAHLVAGGMDETTVYGLLRDVSAVLKLEVTT